MTRFVPMAQFLGVWIFLTLSQPGIGDESSPKGRTNNRYTELISQLVSPNKAPTIQDGEYDTKGSVKFPLGYDVKAQQRVQAARQAIYDDVEKALPYLARALDDKRYCMTLDFSENDYFKNESVGDICRDAIAAELEVYRDKIAFSGPAHFLHYRFPITKEWLEKRKGRRLAELQVEAVQWAIDRSNTEPYELLRLSKEEFAAFQKLRDADRKIAALKELRLSVEEIAELQKLRATIVRSGKPAAPEHLRMVPMITRDQ